MNTELQGRWIRARLSIPPLLLIALSVHAADRDSELARLEANRAKWVEHGIDDYWVRLRDEACWCLYGEYKPREGEALHRPALP